MLCAFTGQTYAAFSMENIPGEFPALFVLLAQGESVLLECLTYDFSCPQR